MDASARSVDLGDDKVVKEALTTIALVSKSIKWPFGQSCVNESDYDRYLQTVDRFSNALTALGVGIATRAGRLAPPVVEVEDFRPSVGSVKEESCVVPYDTGSEGVSDVGDLTVAALSRRKTRAKERAAQWREASAGRLTVPPVLPSGLCYAPIFKPEALESAAVSLSFWPTVSQLLSMSSDMAASAFVLNRFVLVEVEKGKYHVTTKRKAPHGYSLRKTLAVTAAKYSFPYGTVGYQHAVSYLRGAKSGDFALELHDVIGGEMNYSCPLDAGCSFNALTGMGDPASVKVGKLPSGSVVPDTVSSLPCVVVGADTYYYTRNLGYYFPSDYVTRILGDSDRRLVLAPLFPPRYAPKVRSGDDRGVGGSCGPGCVFSCGTCDGSCC